MRGYCTRCGRYRKLDRDCYCDECRIYKPYDPNPGRIYERGIEILHEHAEETCFRVMKGRNENKGNFAYLEDSDYKRESRIAKMLNFLLWRMKLELDGKQDMEGLCDKMCIDCSYKRYNFHSERAPDHWCNDEVEGWVCQEECECK